LNILGIETSCDETAAAVVENGRWILSSSVSTSLDIHQRYGGIIPEIASRKQLEFIDLVVDRALCLAKLTLSEVDGLAVTSRPGLIGSLLVGLSWARAAAFAVRKPLIEIDHIQSHLYANFLVYKKQATQQQSLPPPLPAIGLVVSGGHTSLFYINNSFDFDLIGQTRDDAAGEAFDKVARILGLGYPGGPVIDRLARTAKEKSLRFPSATLPNSFDFSFSGLKTAVYYHTKRQQKMSSEDVKEIALAFQQSVVRSLVDKSLKCCAQKKVKTLVVGGGVACNSALREQLRVQASKQGIKVFFPQAKFCLDNAAMVAGLGYQYLKKNKNNRGVRGGKSNF
jgi:N6-L-threonylcarbamoyladenine synthase